MTNESILLKIKKSTYSWIFAAAGMERMCNFMENSLGKLLVSTKSAAGGRKTTVLVSSVLSYLLAIFLLANGRAFEKMLNSVSTGKIVQIVMVAWLVGFATYQLFAVFYAARSHCCVYENGVAGVTELSVSNPKATMQNFEIGYDEILNVTESGKTLCLYTLYEKYTVLALVNRAEALREIRARMCGKKNGTAS